METKPTHESRLIISYWHLFAPVLFLAVFVLIAPWLPFFTEHRGEDYWYLFLVICLGFSGCLWVGLPIVSQTFSFSKAGIEHCTLFFFSHQYKWEDVHYVIHLYTGDTLQTKSILIMPKGSFCCLPIVFF